MSQPTLETRIRPHVPTILMVVYGLIIVISIVRLVISNGIGWLGPILSCISLFVFMIWLVRSEPARTTASLPWLIGVSVIGVALAWLASGTAIGFAVIGLIGNLIYIFWYSRFGRKTSEALVQGQPLPSFTLEDEAGNPIQSESFKGHPTIYLFYRGNWCPLCIGQIRELTSHYHELDEHGVQVVLISPQPHENTRELAARFDVTFQFLVDPQNHAARQLGVINELGVPSAIKGYGTDTVLPTVVITDAQGTILFLDQTDNYRVRPEPTTFLYILETAA